MNIPAPDKTSEVPNPEQLALEAQWRNSPELQREFVSAKTYAAFARANARGAAKVYERAQPE